MAGEETIRMYALIRDTRAHVQNVQASVTEIRKAATVAEPVSREAAVALAFAEAARVLPASTNEIASRFAAVEVIFDDHPKVGNFFRDWVVFAENAWHRAQAAWTVAGADFENLQPRLDHVERYLNEAVYWCGYISIPSRLRETMESLRTGQPLDFHWAFQDELSDKEGRNRILLEMSRQPLFLPNGIVDLGTGVVYRIAEKPFKRALSVFRIVMLSLVGFLIAIGWCNMGHWLGISDWLGKPTESRLMCTVYLFLLLGSSAHVLVDALKEHRSKPAGDSFVALDDWVVWAHIREYSILWSIVYLWAGLLMLAWAHSLDWRTAFFAGFSIDSVIDLFLRRFGKASAAAENAITEKVSG